MKRFAAMVLGCAVLLGSVSASQAVELKAGGVWDTAFGWERNTSFYSDGENGDDFVSRSRVRTQFSFIASENLKAVLMLEIGTITWGHTTEGNIGDGSGGALDADGVNVKTKLAYLDWVVPSSDISVRMGIQEISLPSGTGLGNPVLYSDVAGITVNVPFNDIVSLTALWARPFNRYTSDANGQSDEMDIFALLLPVSGEGWNLTPWAAYARIGAGSGYMDYISGADGTFSGKDSTSAWWGGAALSLELFDPLTFALDVMYGSQGSLDYANTDSGDGKYKTRGWFIDATLNYALDWGTVGAFGWFSTGDDYDDIQNGEYGRMPAIGFDNGFYPTGFGMPGSNGIGADTVVSATGIGTWGIGLQLADVSFIEDLSHTLRVGYYRGTNDSDIVKNLGTPWSISGEAVYLTDKDYALEVNFEHTYKIYENLTAFLELGYIYLDLDKATWREDDQYDTDDAWKAELLFQYSF
jgi:hypothetical protein